MRGSWTVAYPSLRALRALSFSAAGCLLLHGASAGAQISLSTAVNLALENSPRVKIAQADLDRARAVWTEAKDLYVPSLSANAGVGREVGAPLGPPVVFRVDAQSLVFSFSQPDYIRAARAGFDSAQLALDAARTDVSEDTVNTYLALDNTEQRRTAEADAFADADRLVVIVGDRFTAGVDPHVELTRARRTAAQTHLALFQLDDEIINNQEHLASLTGLPATGLQTVRDTIPEIPAPAPPSNTALDDPERYLAGSAAFAVARSRASTAEGDRHALMRPQVSFAANYSRLSDAFTSYDIYYPGFPGPLGHPNSFNSLSAGIQVTFPLLDMVRRAHAHESAADAAHALYDAQIQQANFIEGRVRLRHNAAELAIRTELASLDHDLSKDELDAVMLRLQAVNGTAGGPQSSPKDEENARLAERQRTIDLLNAELQLHQSEISLMRQEGSLARYLASILAGSGETPSIPTSPGTSVPSSTVAAPGGTPRIAPAPNPAGTAPPPASETGIPQITLPSAPESTAPAAPAQPTTPGLPHN